MKHFVAEWQQSSSMLGSESLVRYTMLTVATALLREVARQRY